MHTVAPAPDRPAGIITPEAVVLEFETAGTASRVLSALIDFTLQFIAFTIVVFATAFTASSTGTAGNWVVTAVLILAVFLILLGYPAAVETLWNGRSVGMAAAGLRVVTVEGGPVRFRHAAIRTSVGMVELWVTLGIPAMLATILSRRNQRLGDMVAGTIVLRERTGLRRPTALGFAPPPGWDGYAATLDVSALTDDQYAAVRAFLHRSRDLTPSARWSLAVRLANATSVRIRHDPPPGVPPELFLLCVAAAFQRRHAAMSAWQEAPGAWRPSWS